jgi:hypothetical protein
MKKYILTLILGLFTFTGFSQYLANFEAETKLAYTSGTVTLSGIDWDMTESLIGNITGSDYFVGSKSARFRGRNGSSMTMVQNKNNGIGNISFTYKIYSTDGSQQPYSVQYSIDNGLNWTQIGSNITATSTVQTFNQSINISGNVRVRIIIASSPGTTGNRRFNIDDILLTDYMSALPITLMSFTAQKRDNCNLLEWSTASELNNDYFLIERSTDGINWNIINKTTGAGNSNYLINYSFTDYNFENTVNYYRLTQVDYNGVFETFKVVCANNTKKDKKVVGVINTSGQEVPIDTKGLLIITYEDGSSIRIMN